MHELLSIRVHLPFSLPTLISLCFWESCFRIRVTLTITGSTSMGCTSGHREYLYTYVRTRACTRLTDICIQTNVRYTTRARALAARTYTRIASIGRQKDQMCVGRVGGGVGGRGKKERGDWRTKEGGGGGGTADGDRKTHIAGAACEARRLVPS